jgi:hypothetical protein
LLDRAVAPRKPSHRRAFVYAIQTLFLIATDAARAVSTRKALLPGRAFHLQHVSQSGLTYTTSIPIERAVPLMLLIAESIDAAFKSGIFCVAISRTCFSVTLPTLSLFGVPDPF